ncbi:hypothetical protein BLNAU_2586 [Blattamonas nauphoetae]|uniref:Uncharacterized protein n=1 Tax=Blattamonas nauphoetae TaxID=2049346 RepID=A0ABQ9YEY4_9EUKA|nr:hypothetical protein BLNAU_2586 [Blattamonas nauphoetae]
MSSDHEWSEHEDGSQEEEISPEVQYEPDYEENEEEQDEQIEDGKEEGELENDEDQEENASNGEEEAQVDEGGDFEQAEDEQDDPQDHESNNEQEEDGQQEEEADEGGEEPVEDDQEDIVPEDDAEKMEEDEKEEDVEEAPDDEKEEDDIDEEQPKDEVDNEGEEGDFEKSEAEEEEVKTREFGAPAEPEEQEDVVDDEQEQGSQDEHEEEQDEEEQNQDQQAKEIDPESEKDKEQSDDEGVIATRDYKQEQQNDDEEEDEANKEEEVKEEKIKERQAKIAEISKKTDDEIAQYEEQDTANQDRNGNDQKKKKQNSSKTDKQTREQEAKEYERRRRQKQREAERARLARMEAQWDNRVTPIYEKPMREYNAIEDKLCPVIDSKHMRRDIKRHMGPDLTEEEKEVLEVRRKVVERENRDIGRDYGLTGNKRRGEMTQHEFNRRAEGRRQPTADGRGGASGDGSRRRGGGRGGGRGGRSGARRSGSGQRQPSRDRYNRREEEGEGRPVTREGGRGGRKVREDEYDEEYRSEEEPVRTRSFESKGGANSRPQSNTPSSLGALEENATPSPFLKQFDRARKLHNQMMEMKKKEREDERKGKGEESDSDSSSSSSSSDSNKEKEEKQKKTKSTKIISPKKLKSKIEKLDGADSVLNPSMENTGGSRASSSQTPSPARTKFDKYFHALVESVKGLWRLLRVPAHNRQAIAPFLSDGGMGGGDTNRYEDSGLLTTGSTIGLEEYDLLYQHLDELKEVDDKREEVLGELRLYEEFENILYSGIAAEEDELQEKLESSGKRGESMNESREVQQYLASQLNPLFLRVLQQATAALRMLREYESMREWTHNELQRKGRDEEEELDRRVSEIRKLMRKYEDGSSPQGRGGSGGGGDGMRDDDWRGRAGEDGRPRTSEGGQRGGQGGRSRDTRKGYASTEPHSKRQGGRGHSREDGPGQSGMRKSAASQKKKQQADIVGKPYFFSFSGMQDPLALAMEKEERRRRMAKTGKAGGGYK